MAASPAPAEKHAVVVARPFSAGQHIRVDVEASEDVKAVEAEGEGQEIDVSGLTGQRRVTLRGVMDVQAVDDEGRVSRASFQVEHFFDSQSNEEILPMGSELLVTREGDQPIVLVNGEQPRSDIAPWLRLAFPLLRPGGMIVSEVLGTSKPKAVGDTWEVSKAKVVNDMKEDGYSTTETHVEGEAQLLGTTPCEPGMCLEVAAKIAADAVAVSDLKGTGTGKVGAGAMEGEARLLLPEDATQPVFLEDGTSRMSFTIELEGDGSHEGGDALVQATRRRIATYTLLPSD